MLSGSELKEWEARLAALDLEDAPEESEYQLMVDWFNGKPLATKQVEMRKRHEAQNVSPPRHWSPQDSSESWGVSVDTVRRLFEREPGVLVIGSERYRTLRIPQEVVARVQRKREVVC